jgi:hypothetical protein
MSLDRLFLLADGLLSRCVDDNPFRFGRSTAPIFFVPVKPLNQQPVRPTLDAVPLDDCPRRQPLPIDRVELALVKLILTVLVFTLFVCGLGVQHISYVRQRSEFSRELCRKELELRALTQAYHSLESLVGPNSSADLRRQPTWPVAARRPSQKESARG